MTEPKSQAGAAAPESEFASVLLPAEKAELVRDVYRKHAAELLTIEEAQQKLILLLLGVFGAGASFLASEKSASLSFSARLGLSVVVLGIIIVGWRYTGRRDNARRSVRDLLTQCERAMGLYDNGVFLAAGPLYQSELRQFALKGRWLSYTFWVAALAALGFLLVLWSPYLSVLGCRQ